MIIMSRNTCNNNGNNACIIMSIKCRNGGVIMASCNNDNVVIIMS